MAKFRKKPVVVEAVQWDGLGFSADMPMWLQEARVDGRVFRDPPGSYCLAIMTLEGKMSASEGDWIIRGVAGELYPCKPDIFEATYEAVD